MCHRFPKESELMGKIEFTHYLARYTKRELGTYDISTLKNLGDS